MYPTFNDYIKSKGWNQKRLAEAARINPGVFSHRVNGRQDWQWTEVCNVCAALGITLDEFATYYPVADVRKSTATPAISQDDITEFENLRIALINFLKGA